MNIKQKVSLGTILMAIVPAIVIGLWVGITTRNVGIEVLEKQVASQFTSIRESKKTEIKSYFQYIKDQIITFSDDRMIIDAMNDFASAYFALQPSTQSMKNNIKQYYDTQFSPMYTNKNPGKSININQLLAPLDQESIYLQYHYLSNNRHALGEKHLLNSANDNSNYSTIHEKYHPHIRKFLETFGYYDIFLVEPKHGDIIYSVFKELDYTTSLKNGPYANSGLAKAFRGAHALSRDEIYLTDFHPYTPSYESAAAFMASPIFDQDRRIGVLVFQMPIDKINQIMTSSSRWEEQGYGKTGESYLVGEDFLLRNEMRTLVEDETHYWEALQNSGLDAQTISSIQAKGSAIGLQAIKSEAVEKALQGETGFIPVENYRQKRVLSAFTPMRFETLNWAIISEIEESEALAGIIKLKSSIAVTVSLVILATAILGTILGRYFANRLVMPIIETADSMLDIYKGDGDLTKRLPVRGQDEIAKLASNFNGFSEKVQNTVKSFVETVDSLKKCVQILSSISEKSSTLVNDQSKQSDQIAAAITEMATSVQQVAKNAETVANASEKSRQDTEEAKTIFETTLNGIGDMTNKIKDTSQVVNELESETKNIGSVLDVIRGIAEQTNLLALNAAIEAARAGEQGRGFAVVADEVRTLASRTQASTQEIEEMISRLQAGAARTVVVMNESNQSAQTSIEHGHEARHAISSTATTATEISNMMLQIAASTDEQSAVSENIHKSVMTISSSASEVAQEFDELNRSVASLIELAHKLDSKAKEFKV